MSVELTTRDEAQVAGMAGLRGVTVPGGPQAAEVPRHGWPEPVTRTMDLLRDHVGRAVADLGVTVDVRPLGLPMGMASGVDPSASTETPNTNAETPNTDAETADTRAETPDTRAGVPDTRAETADTRYGDDGHAGNEWPVLAVRWGAGVVLVGPLTGTGTSTDGGAGPCATCLDRRWLALRPLEERHAIDCGGAAFVAGEDPWLTPFALDAVGRLARLAAPGQVYELRLADLSVARHPLVADSACPDCARPTVDTAEHAEVRLTPRPKTTPTSYRLRPASDIGLDVAGYANPVCGMLGVAAMRAYHCTATAPVSGFFRVRSKYDLHDMWWSGHADSYGESELLAVLEGLERYAGQFPRARTSSVYASLAELTRGGVDALDPTACGTYTADFYHDHRLFYEPFSPDRPLSWVWGWSMRDDRPRLVPEQLVFYLDWRAERKFVQECSNGCASGSSVEEAVLHGVLELLERDAFLLCWFGAARLPEIDLRTVRNPRTRFMADRVEQLGYRVRLFDMRVDTPVPVVMAVAERRDGQLGTLCFSAGASPDPEDAVRAALCEAASYVPGFEERVVAELPRLHRMVTDHNEVTELAHHALLYGMPEVADRADFLFRDAPLRSMDDLYAGWLAERGEVNDLADDARMLVDLVTERIGSDVVVIDQTCPEQRSVGLTTVAVVAPGLIPIDFGWRRQRVLTSERLRAFVAGELPQVWPRADGLGATGLHPYPHPFP